MKTDDELDDGLRALFQKMREIEPLAPEVVNEERMKFLNKGEVFRKSQAARPEQRRVGFFDSFLLAIQPKQRKFALNFLVVMAVVVTALFGGGGAVVLAAQDSLPGEAIYPVKTFSEDARLLFATSDQSKLDLILQYTERRVDEIASLLTSQKQVPVGVFIRLEQQLNAALQIAAHMDSEQMVQALMQIQERVEVQSQTMTALNAGTQPANALLLQLEARLRQQSQIAAQGAADPQVFQLQMRFRQNQDASQQPGSDNPLNATGTPLAPGNSYGPGPVYGDPTQLPGQFGVGPFGPNTTQTPNPGIFGYGPGPEYGVAQTPFMYGSWWTLTPTMTPMGVQNGAGQGHSNSSNGNGQGGKK